MRRKNERRTDDADRVVKDRKLARGLQQRPSPQRYWKQTTDIATK